jgi:tellurite methyltransferase
VSAEDRRKWDAKHGERGVPGEPSSSVVALEGFLPRTGRALDVAGGAGRHALWLARRGLDVTLVDVSPVALDIARAHAGGLRLTTQLFDADNLDDNDSVDGEPLPSGPWDLIFCSYFLDRRVYRTFAALLAPGGTLVVDHPTIANLERHPSPAAAHLLDPGELPGFAAGLEILFSDEGWTAEGRHEARLVARRSI